MKNVLYISYDGLMEPLGHSQVFQYLRELARDQTIKIVLLTFEKKQDWQDRERRIKLQEQVKKAGVHWIALRYHRRPTLPATAWDIFQGLSVGTYLILRHRIRIIHARSYVAGYVACLLSATFHIPFIFDMRGFWADERVEGGWWPANSRLYRLAKKIESLLLRRTRAIVSLSHAGAKELERFPAWLENRPRIEVISTCTNLDLFKLRPAQKQPSGNPITLGYVGSVDHWYMFDPVLLAFATVLKLRPGSRLKIVNRDAHSYIEKKILEHAIPRELVDIQALSHTQVPQAMAEMDATLFFIRPTFSKRASAPTKLGEFLACGIPCLTGPGIGDVEQILGETRTGIIIKDESEENLAESVKKLLALLDEPGIRERCRQAAEEHFSLQAGVRAYAGVYQELALFIGD